MKSNLSINFYLSKTKEKGDKFPIYLRIIYSRKKAECFTGLYIEDKNWNSAKQRAKKDNQINDQLGTIETKINTILYNLEKDEKQVSASLIKNLYTGKDKIEETLLNYFELHIKGLQYTNELAKNSISRYIDTFQHLDVFLKQKNKTDLLLRKVDFKFLNEFDSYLKTQISSISKQVLERNTVNKHHSRLRTVLIKAVKESQLSKNPYQEFKFTYTPSKRTFLTIEELDRIIELDLNNHQSLAKVRDLFIFSVFTGLRFQDAQQLRTNQVIIEKDNAYLDFTQSKTLESLKVPLLQPAKDIIEKYKTTESKITGLVLPKISNQKFNTYLKIIGELAQIEKVLTHHVARHTCATTILLNNEASMEEVGKWLGHKNIRTTQIYAKISNEQLKKVAEKVSKKLYK